MISKALEKGSKYKDTLWKSVEGREKMVKDIIDAVNLYESELANLLFEYPAFATGYYYCWESFLVDNGNNFYDDFRYDLQCMYFNVAAMLMNITEYLLGWQMTPSNASMLEKESYRFLLQAAGYFGLLQEMAHDVKTYSVGITELKRPDDIEVDFLEFFRLLALTQAQEIGTTKAIEKEISGGKSMVVRLSHQVLRLYKEALGFAQNRIASFKNEFLDILTFVQLKADVFEALTFSHAASAIFDSRPSEGLWFASQAEIFAKVVVNHRDQARMKKRVIPFSGEDLIQNCCDIVRRNCERITRINLLVHRVKPEEGPLALPPAYELAQMKQVQLPAKFPHQLTQPPAPLPPAEGGNQASD
ncbi:hypothetical protein TRSC58_02240 [Trypanosoma rangeli SC58]|uniref:BRO1 domain-containing protein n=1 Tax=Trypanosoma rangeli SC58 TaxID=429131 RepID=A0A061J9S7_TRYRA|nr:hypothetical protein TRSC58_02240 [Trypanosoma rangeli SC58]